MPFEIDLSQFKPLKLDPARPTLTPEQRAALQANIQLCRDAIVYFTAVADAKGLGGHTGGAFDTVPEVLIAQAFCANNPDFGIPTMYDEAGHRVATQYLLSVLSGAMPAEKLMHYREFNQQLPGHPERGLTPGVNFSSGRLGHMWPFVNGVAIAHPGKVVFMLGSDGSQMEGDDAEAARLCVAQKLNIKLLVDDNDVTIAGFPSKYLCGYDVAQTLEGHGMLVIRVNGEDLDALYAAMCKACTTAGPVAVVIKRKMAPGITGLEGSNHAHESIKMAPAVAYLEARGHAAAAAVLKNAKGEKCPIQYKGSTGAGKNRDDFGKIINAILEPMSEAERLDKVRVFDCDLEGSCGLHHIRKKFPQVYVSAGIMERGNFSAAAGFGAEPGRVGIVGTFSAFLEMCISEITMARLNKANVIAHFSHAGVDDMADNTCHFGINNFFADNGLPEHDTTRLYFPADQHQFAACVKQTFADAGLRFVFSTRSAVPDILKEDGTPFFGQGYSFQAGKDDIIRQAKDGGGYVVSFGDTLYRALDAVIRLQEQGVNVGLINKSTLNLYDEATMQKLAAAPFVLVAEGFNVKNGLGARFGTELLKRGFKGKYNNIGAHREGPGGLWQQVGYQGLDPDSIIKSVQALV
jgi:transketolase